MRAQCVIAPGSHGSYGRAVTARVLLAYETAGPRITIVKMTAGQGDLRWEAFVTAMLASGPVQERRSRYADKLALFLDGREIAHLEAPGVIDLRISQKGWARARDDYRDDPAIRRDPSRRDWIELQLRSPADLDGLAGLLAIAVAANS